MRQARRNAKWKAKQTTLKNLEEEIGIIKFQKVYHDADQKQSRTPRCGGRYELILRRRSIAHSAAMVRRSLAT